MKQTLIILSLIMIPSVGMACNFSSEFPYIEISPEQNENECIPAEPTEQDINDILSFYKKTFDVPGWERSYAVTPDRVAVTWMHNEFGGLAYFENLLYSCGGAYEQIDEYLSKDSFEIIFKDYDSYKETDTCQMSGLHLYQFDVINQGEPYQIRYWAEPQSDTRVYITMLVFPTASPHMDEYAESLYPQLTVCR